MSTIKDSKLASVGKDEVNWALRQMQVLEDIKIDFEKRKPLDGLNIGACMHVTKETANLMLTLKLFPMVASQNWQDLQISSLTGYQD